MKNQYISAGLRKKYQEKARIERSIVFHIFLHMTGSAVKKIFNIPAKAILKGKKENKKRRTSNLKSGAGIVNYSTV
ncbi:hypothetical protein MNBD_ALPHA08-2102 [hydrothermal vent metagenome]|uniref:Uncharacterized protein n=1 Tax=hydrothermal vent metagenome TaxID=652676 RepID=A0A3B0RBT3_9ZZZZ